MVFSDPLFFFPHVGNVVWFREKSSSRLPISVQDVSKSIDLEQICGLMDRLPG